MPRQFLPTALALGLATIVAGTAAGPAVAGHYRAEPAYAPMNDRLVLRNTVWQRSGAAYEAGKSNSRPATVCAALAREVGQLKSFSIGGAPVSGADLEKCNARAAQ